MFQVILEKFGLMPITSDSHFGEYIQWAYDVTDHKGILDFYRFYKEYLANVQPKIELRLGERIIPIIEGILTDSGYVEEAVNIPNRGLIANLPEWIVVEVPATVDKRRRARRSPGRAAARFRRAADEPGGGPRPDRRGGHPQVQGDALQALLVDPVVNQYRGLEEMLDTMIAYQEKWLGYLR